MPYETRELYGRGGRARTRMGSHNFGDSYNAPGYVIPRAVAYPPTGSRMRADDGIEPHNGNPALGIYAYRRTVTRMTIVIRSVYPNCRDSLE